MIQIYFNTFLYYSLYNSYTSYICKVVFEIFKMNNSPLRALLSGPKRSFQNGLTFWFPSTGHVCQPVGPGSQNHWHWLNSGHSNYSANDLFSSPNPSIFEELTHPCEILIALVSPVNQTHSDSLWLRILQGMTNVTIPALCNMPT